MKIILTVATICQILTQKCTKFDFGWGSGGGYNAPLAPIVGGGLAVPPLIAATEHTMS